jgi:glucuronokinase
VKVSVFARAALAGNPSDMYGGAVLAIPVRSFAAHAESYGTSVEPASALVDAARARTAAAGIRWSTDIPRSVGLAGSSALVIATLRAGGVHLPPVEIAQLALAVERDDLGILGGLQDRVVQAFDDPVLVDVSAEKPAVTQMVPARPLWFVVAWTPTAASDSGEYHAAVASDVDRGGMAELALIAREAGDAFAAGDASRLAELMSASAAVRARVAPLPPAHEALADALRRVGLSPNSAGSGGAVVAVLDGDAPELDVPFVIETFG